MYNIFATLAVVFIMLAFISFVFFRTHDNKKFSKEVNDSIKYLVEQVIQVQYYTHDKKILEEIFTEELLENYEDSYNGFFREKSTYFMRKNYMQTLRYSENEEQWTVSIRIREAFFDDGVWLVISVIQDEDGEYRIADIGLDV